MNPQDTQSASTPQDRPPRRINMWWVFALMLIAIYVINYRPDIDAIACNDEVLATDPDVIMLGTWWCPYCAEARRYFHDNQVHYCEFDIERTEEGKRRYQEADGRGIPVLIFGERYKLNGYDENMVERALALLEQEKPGDDH